MSLKPKLNIIMRKKNKENGKQPSVVTKLPDLRAIGKNERGGYGKITFSFSYFL